ncbi:hypothetical protein AWN90_04215 [Nocardia terpenica]|uniref:Uncharacterized protein n=1 Tax=Nocardia terpenica TaxID=455432 RepID=A0A164IX63_9NOCA|nr:hypothetical protein AWN90_04215 [Nocardia terpenica]
MSRGDFQQISDVVIGVALRMDPRRCARLNHLVVADPFVRALSDLGDLPVQRVDVAVATPLQFHDRGPCRNIVAHCPGDDLLALARRRPQIPGLTARALKPRSQFGRPAPRSAAARAAIFIHH